MKNSIPTDKEWKELYKAAIEFREIHCWDWMDDTEIFGVKNPIDGEIAYCCVMGALGELFGLNGYLGTEGLEGYFKMQSTKDVEMEWIEAFYLQKCIIVTFENKNQLERRDREILKHLGLSFKGSNAWPLFRSYLPGYAPWYLTGEEVRFLTVILQQAKEVALDFKRSWHLLNPPSEKKCLVRVVVEQGGDLKWRDNWLEFPQPYRKEIIVPPVNVNYLAKIKNENFRRSNIIECNIFYVPTAIQGGERPFFPLASLFVDYQSGLILKSDISEHQEYRSNFQNAFLKLIEEMRCLPKEVRVKKEEVYRLLEPITSNLGIKLVLTKSIHYLEDAQKSLTNTFMSHLK